MSNLKDSDIDDLFRRASDKYPLRTDSADWDRMAAALENKGAVPPIDGVDAEEKRKKRRFFWLFLLLPLAGAGYYAVHHSGNAANGNQAVTQSSPAANAGSGSDANAATDGGADTKAGAATNGGAVTTDGSTTNEIKRTKPDKSLSLTAASARRQPGGENSSDKFGDENGAFQNGANQNGDAQNGNTQNGHSKKRRGKNGAIGTGDENEGSGNEVTGGGNVGGETNGGSNDRLFYDLQRAAIPHDYRLAVNVTAPVVKKDSTVKPKAKTKHFYAGVFGSPDLSTVKMQSVEGVGTTFGVILGYTFNGGRWAVETGAYLDRKKYYSDGEYFDTKEVRLPYNSYLTDVNGICYMWEIPLNVRYNFNPGAKTSWFATAGLSTYLMSREKYTYGLEWPGSTAQYDSTWNFHKASQYPFSIINLSAGFEQRLGKIGNLRVEPYVRIPLTGLGTGKLPIMSAGVNIGITRQLW